MQQQSPEDELRQIQAMLDQGAFFQTPGQPQQEEDQAGAPAGPGGVTRGLRRALAVPAKVGVAVGRGSVRGLNETANTAVGAAAWAYKTTGLHNVMGGEDFLNWYEGRKDREDPLGERAPGAYGFVEAAAQFGIGFIGFKKFIAPFQLAGKAGKALDVGKRTGLIAGFGADVTAFDPYEERISNLVEDGPAWLSNPLTQMLAADEDDSELAGRIKNGFEGMLTGAAVEGLLFAARGVRAARKARSGKLTPEEYTTEVTKLAEDAQRAIDADTGAARVTHSTDGSSTVELRAAAVEGAEVVPAATPVAPAATAATAAPTQLPRDLAGAKPRYGFGDKKFGLQFEDDIDRALYIVAQKKPSKRDGDYMAWLRKALPDQTDDQIRAQGSSVRDRIKAMARESDAETLTIPSERVRPEAPNASAAAPAAASAGPVSRTFQFRSAAEAERFAASVNEAVDNSLKPRDYLTPEQAQQVDGIFDRIMSGADPDDWYNLMDGIQFNFSRYSSPDEVRALINAISERFPERVTQLANRHKDGLGQSHKETLARAEGLLHGRTAEETVKIFETLTGRTEGLSVIMTAARIAFNDLGAQAVRLGRIAEETGSALDVEKARHALSQLRKAHDSLAPASAESGRLLDAHKINVGSDAAGRKFAESAVDATGTPTPAREAVADVFEGMTDREILATLRLLSHTDGNTATIIEMLTNMQAGSRAARKGVKEPSQWDNILGFRVNMMLSGPKTHVVNSVSTAVASFQIPFEHFWAGARTGNRALRQEGWDLMTGNFAYLTESLGAARKAWQAGENILDVRGLRDDALSQQVAKGGAGPVGWLQTLARLPSRALLTSDEFFKNMTYRSQIRAKSLREAGERASRMGMNDPHLRSRYIANMVADDMKAAFSADGMALNAKAREYARTVTFTNDLEYGVGKSLHEMANKHPMVRIVFPFVRTPVNLIRYAWQRTPILNRWQKQFADDIAAGGERAAIANAKSELGGTMYMVAASLAMNGVITGGGPKETRLRQQWLEAKNQPYSIRVGDRLISYRRTDPMLTGMMVVADFVEALGEMNSDDAEELMWSATAAFASSLSSKTFLQGMTEFFDAAASGEPWRVERTMRSFQASFHPNFLRQVNPDDGFREVRGLLDEIISRTPGWSESLEPRRNLFGEPSARPPGYFNRSFNPFTTVRLSNRDETMQALVELGESMAMPPARLMNGQIDLRDREKWGGEKYQSPYDRMLELMDSPGNGRRNLRADLERLIESDRWANASSGTALHPGGRRYQMAAQIVQQHQQRAERQMLREYPELRATLRGDAVLKRQSLRRQDQQLLNP
jgi:hypothetical protein